MTQTQIHNFSLDNAYADAVEFTRSHYENFPVIGLLLPKHLRKHIAVFYRFARQADDIADEGNFTNAERIQKLDEYEQDLRNALDKKFKNSFWSALKNTMDSYSLTESYFFDLLTAFKQDVHKKRYDDFGEVLAYCKNSANPVGRIILEFFGVRGKKAADYSDAVCTALQITNFYQDAGQDFERGRIYIPLKEMADFGVDEKLFQLKENNANFKTLLKYQIERANGLFKEGRNLLPLLPGNLKRQILLTILGGEAVLKKIIDIDYDVLNIRPKLSKTDFVILFIKTITG